MRPRENQTSLTHIVAGRPFPEFSQWWKMGRNFIRFMSTAIYSQWRELDGVNGDLDQIQGYLTEYIRLVYGQNAAPTLVDDFIRPNLSRDYYSGEFDALSYAFYRSAFEAIADKHGEDKAVFARERREFAVRVGRLFFTSIHAHLQLDLPSDLRDPHQFASLQKSIGLIEKFLLAQGYLRDHCEFTFSVDITYSGEHILQGTDDFLNNLHHNGVGYALYIMGYPAILPSAVYLFQMFGEAQHHSSRTIEEMFIRVGYQARETDDFDPSNFPSDKVVELWSISP